MYIETPDGEEMLDALNQKEAREILADFRRQQKDKLFYECVNCGFLSREKKFCPACQDTHQKVFGAFESIEDAMAQEIEEKGGNI
jgi:rubrerythrin